MKFHLRGDTRPTPGHIPGHVPGHVPGRSRYHQPKDEFDDVGTMLITPPGADTQNSEYVDTYTWMFDHRISVFLDMWPGLAPLEFLGEYGAKIHENKSTTSSLSMIFDSVFGVFLAIAHYCVVILIYALLVWTLLPVLTLACACNAIWNAIWSACDNTIWGQRDKGILGFLNYIALNFFTPTFFDILVWGNFVASVFHLFLSGFVIQQGTKGEWKRDNDGVPNGYVRLPVWLQILDITTSCTGGGGVGGTSDAPFELYPDALKAQCQNSTSWIPLHLLGDSDCELANLEGGTNTLGINLTRYTQWFFLLSGAFHFLNVLIMLVERNAVIVSSSSPSSRNFLRLVFNWLNLKYLANIDQCKQPLRWIEYSISASLMMVIVSFFSGVRDVRMLFALFGLMFCVITYGWVCESLSRPKPVFAFTTLSVEYIPNDRKELVPKLDRGGKVAKKDIQDTRSSSSILGVAVFLAVVWAVPFWRLVIFAMEEEDPDAPTTGRQADFTKSLKTFALAWGIACGVLSMVYFLGAKYGEDSANRTSEKKDDKDDKMPVNRWNIDGNPLSPFNRLAPNLLGYIPYYIAWVIPLDTFYYAIDQIDCESTGRCPPDFVNLILWGQFALFSVFSIVSIYQQLNGKLVGIRYAWGELLYVALSLASKGALGAILIGNILFVAGNVDEALVNGGNQTGNSGDVRNFTLWREALCLQQNCEYASEKWFQCNFRSQGRFYTEQAGTVESLTNNGSCAVWHALGQAGCSTT